MAKKTKPKQPYKKFYIVCLECNQTRAAVFRDWIYTDEFEVWIECPDCNEIEVVSQ